MQNIVNNGGGRKPAAMHYIIKNLTMNTQNIRRDATVINFETYVEQNFERVAQYYVDTYKAEFKNGKEFKDTRGDAFYGLIDSFYEKIIEHIQELWVNEVIDAQYDSKTAQLRAIKVKEHCEKLITREV